MIHAEEILRAAIVGLRAEYEAKTALVKAMLDARAVEPEPFDALNARLNRMQSEPLTIQPKRRGRPAKAKSGPIPVAAKKKRKMSQEGRARLLAALKRWDKARAEKKKAKKAA